MQQLATITSKRQLTIPIMIFKKFGFQKGNKVIVSVEDEVIKIIPASSLIEKLAGSVKVPEKYKSVPIRQVIEEAKKTYFENKK